MDTPFSFKLKKVSHIIGRGRGHPLGEGGGAVAPLWSFSDNLYWFYGIKYIAITLWVFIGGRV